VERVAKPANGFDIVSLEPALLSLDEAPTGRDSSRYFFGLLDHRSKLAKGFFSGTFLTAKSSPGAAAIGYYSVYIAFALP
jgi:hypothetical protein